MKDAAGKNEAKYGTVSVNYDAERLNALYKYMGDKNLNLELEIFDMIERLYERHVPPTVKEYISFRASGGNANQ